MTPLALLILAQESLPPPPEPTGSPEIDTARVIGVVVVSLGVIVLVALAIRPLVVRPRRPGPGDEPESQIELPEAADLPPVPGSIIPFPRQFTVEATGQGPARTESTALQERLNRVGGDQTQRRKLGDRQPVWPALEANIPAARVTPIRGAVGPANRRGTAAPRSSEVAEIPSDQPAVEAVEPAGVRDRSAQAVHGADAAAAAPDDRAVTSGPLAGATPAGDTETGRTARDDEPTGRTDMPDAFATTELEQRAPGAESPPEARSRPAERQTSELAMPAQPEPGEIDLLTLGALHQLVRELLHCANTGDLLHGFALYSDPFLFRFMDGSGMSEDEFREFYGSLEARPRDAWDQLDRLFDIVPLPDGRIEATASYVDTRGVPSNGLERYRFVDVDGVWMIDDISPVESPR